MGTCREAQRHLEGRGGSFCRVYLWRVSSPCSSQHLRRCTHLSVAGAVHACCNEPTPHNPHRERAAACVGTRLGQRSPAEARGDAWQAHS